MEHPLKDHLQDWDMYIDTGGTASVQLTDSKPVIL